MRYILPVLLFLILGGMFHLPQEDPSKIKIIVCKDDVKRLFFAGEEYHFLKYQEVFDREQCNTRIIAYSKWEKTLKVFQKRATKPL